jgi:basic membrane protein A
VYTDSFADVQLAAEAAQSFIDNGHAVLTGTAQMTVGAIGVARESSVPWFGTQSNQTTVGPEIVVANQVYRWDVVLDDLVRDIQAGTYGGNSYEINFANGGLVIEYNDAYDLPADVRAAGDAAVANFTAGGAAGEEVLDAEPLRAAVVTPSAENDLAFSQSIVDALHRMEAAGLLSEVAITPGTFIVEDAGVALRNYAEEGYDLVIAHGSQYGGLLEEIAPSFPGTAFAWGTSVETFGQANISAYTTRSDQGGYAMGLAAAVIAGGSPVGIVGPIEVGDAKLFVDGFTAGVEAGGGTANAVYTDSFADVQLAAEAAQSFIDNGHAVLTGTAQMTVGAIGVARESSVPWFGTQSNQTTVGPEIVVANQVYRWDVVLDDLVRDIQAGTYGGNSYEINFANGGLVIEYNDAYDLGDSQRGERPGVQPVHRRRPAPHGASGAAQRGGGDAGHVRGGGRRRGAAPLRRGRLRPGHSPRFPVRQPARGDRPRLPGHRLRLGHLGGYLRPAQHLGLHHLIRRGRLRDGTDGGQARRRLAGGDRRPDKGRRRRALCGRLPSRCGGRRRHRQLGVHRVVR